MHFGPSFGLQRDPFALMRQLQGGLDPTFTPATAGRFPPVNIWQGPDSAAVTAELPGVEPNDLEITVKDNLLTLAGERKAPETDDSTVWHRRERSYGRFSRVIRLPFRVDPDRVEARFHGGVLQVELHRPEADKPRRIEIKAG